MVFKVPEGYQELLVDSFFSRTLHVCDPNLGKYTRDCSGCTDRMRMHDHGDEDPQEWINYSKRNDRPLTVEGKL